MTNVENGPVALTATGPPAHGSPADRSGTDARAQLLTPRDVPLGGLRAMTVRRTLPQRARSFIGAWCFLDHYGPDDVAVTGGMRVPPHPHTGLQTVSWLFSGEVEHRDSLGTHTVVRPGEMNLMTAGRGISHSEDSTDATTVLHGVQLWTVLPERLRGTEPGFEHHVPTPVPLPGGELRVFLGSLAGATSPGRTFSPLVGAELRLTGGTGHTFDVDPSFEHGLLVDRGVVEVAGARVDRGELLYVPPGGSSLTVRAAPGPDVRAILIGGEPLGEQVVMWWNFIGRDHADVERARQQWQVQIGADDAVIATAGDPSAGDTGRADLAGPEGVPPAGMPDRHPTGTTASRYGTVAGHPDPPLPAPALPRFRLKPRG